MHFAIIIFNRVISKLFATFSHFELNQFSRKTEYKENYLDLNGTNGSIKHVITLQIRSVRQEGSIIKCGNREYCVCVRFGRPSKWWSQLLASSKACLLLSILFLFIFFIFWLRPMTSLSVLVRLILPLLLIDGNVGSLIALRQNCRCHGLINSGHMLLLLLDHRMIRRDVHMSEGIGWHMGNRWWLRCARLNLWRHYCVRQIGDPARAMHGHIWVLHLIRMLLVLGRHIG